MRLGHTWYQTLTAAAVGIAALSPARAVTCDDVRSLTREEQEYWAKRLNLTSEQQREIWRACYGTELPRRPKVVPVTTER